MKVKCERLRDGDARSHEEFLTLGRAYVVYSLLASPRFGIKVRLLTDLGGNALGLFPIEMFSIVDGRLSPRWQAAVTHGGDLEFAPPAWLRAGFWEDSFEPADLPASPSAEPDRASVIESEMKLIADHDRTSGGGSFDRD